MKHLLHYVMLFMTILLSSCEKEYDSEQPDFLQIHPLILSFTDADQNDLLQNVPAEGGLLADPRYFVGYIINDDPVNLSSNIWGPVQYEVGLQLKHREEKLSLMSTFSDAFGNYLRNYIEGEERTVHLTIKLKCPTLFGEEKIHLLEGDWHNDGKTVFPVEGSVTWDGTPIKLNDGNKAIIQL